MNKDNIFLAELIKENSEYIKKKNISITDFDKIEEKIPNLLNIKTKYKNLEDNHSKILLKNTIEMVIVSLEKARELNDSDKFKSLFRLLSN